MTDFEIMGPYAIALLMSIGALCAFVWGVLSGAFLAGAAVERSDIRGAVGRLGRREDLLTIAIATSEACPNGAYDDACRQDTVHDQSLRECLRSRSPRHS